jgi:DNA-binding HxlR family transcriptional regulator
VGVRTDGQDCPIARAWELVAERWSLIILPNIVLVGCRTFNEIAEGAPGLSRGLLSKRLRDLERAGVTRSVPSRTVPARPMSPPRPAGSCRRSCWPAALGLAVGRADP